MNPLILICALCLAGISGQVPGELVAFAVLLIAVGMLGEKVKK